ncbi:MAG TPA: DUF2007 domain-containing protein [Gemmatimonadales bacterium]|nr:DUF2007 domain-containing protein [Gemmatimonadales bacterium]
MNEVVWIRTYPNELGAYRARDLLKTRGIQAVVADDSGLGMEPAARLIRFIRLGVSVEDLNAALAILDGNGNAPQP